MKTSSSISTSSPLRAITFLSMSVSGIGGLGRTSHCTGGGLLSRGHSAPLQLTEHQLPGHAPDREHVAAQTHQDEHVLGEIATQ